LQADVSAPELAGADTFVFDVDGTLVLSDDPNTGAGGARALEGAADLLRGLRHHHKRYVCFTNGTGLVPAAIAAKLRGAGLDVQDADVLTPASVAALHVQHTFRNEPILAFGTEGLLEPLVSAGVHLAKLEDAERARAVLVGADPDFTYAKLTAACRAVWAGATLLVTSMAPYFASAGGRLPSTSGAIAAGIRHVTGADPVIVGKPSPLVLEVAARHLHATPRDLVVIGDDVRLEIRMAREAAAYAVLVLTGSSRLADVEGIPAELRPNLVLPTVGALREYCGLDQ
jgi:HAD superfamily hydrolase (TIGR01450 family)